MSRIESFHNGASGKWAASPGLIKYPTGNSIARQVVKVLCMRSNKNASDGYLKVTSLEWDKIVSPKLLSDGLHLPRGN